MKALHSFALADYLDTLVSYLAAFILGALIGAERQYRQRLAGLRTTILVSIGAAAFVDMAIHLEAETGAVRTIANVVTGVGFLGAGVIMKEGMNIRGLNTAATLWATAAVGACAGADLLAQAITLTAVILAANTLMRPLVHAIDRIPIDSLATEATYSVTVTTRHDAAETARATLVDALTAAGYPVGDTAMAARGDDLTDITATLTRESVNAAELDRVVAALRTRLHTSGAAWGSSVRE